MYFGNLIIIMNIIIKFNVLLSVRYLSPINLSNYKLIDGEHLRS